MRTEWKESLAASYTYNRRLLSPLCKNLNTKEFINQLKNGNDTKQTFLKSWNTNNWEIFFKVFNSIINQGNTSYKIWTEYKWRFRLTMFIVAKMNKKCGRREVLSPWCVQLCKSVWNFFKKLIIDPTRSMNNTLGFTLKGLCC